MVRVFLQYLRRNPVISTVCWHDGGDVYYKTENETSQNGPRTSCYRSRLVCFPGAVFVCSHGRDCDALETGNMMVEYRDTTPLKTCPANRWYQRSKKLLTRHAEPYDLCDTLGTGNPGVEYRDTTPLKIRSATRWYQKEKTALFQPHQLKGSDFLLLHSSEFTVVAS